MPGSSCTSMNNWSLYVITNLVNGKQYVGITQQRPEQRRNEHFSGKGSKLIKNAIRKYGRDNLSFEVLYEGSQQWIAMMEYRTILALGTLAPQGYNLALGGDVATGWRHSEATRRAMSVTRTGSGNGMYGRTHTTETREKIAAKRRGKPVHPNVLSILTRTQGSKNPRARPVLVDHTEYACIKDAAVALGMKPGTLRQYFSKYNRSGHWPDGWAYLDRKRGAVSHV